MERRRRGKGEKAMKIFPEKLGCDGIYERANMSPSGMLAQGW